MTLRMQKLLSRLCAPADGEGSDLGGDRGDDFAPEAKTEDKGEELKAEDEADEADEKPRGKDVTVPKSRLEKEVARRKQLEDRLRQLEEANHNAEHDAQGEKARKNLETEIESLENEYAKHMEAGETDKAAKLTREIRAKERELYKLENTAVSNRTRSALKEEIRVETMIEAFSERYPELNPAHEDVYDQDAVDIIEGLRSRYGQQGDRPSVALKKAVEKWASLKKAEAKEEEAERKGLSGISSPDKRKEQALATALEAKKKQPEKLVAGKDSDAAGGGLDSSKIAKLSDADWEKLPAEARAKARGDFV